MHVDSRSESSRSERKHCGIEVSAVRNQLAADSRQQASQRATRNAELAEKFEILISKS